MSEGFVPGEAEAAAEDFAAEEGAAEDRSVDDREAEEIDPRPRGREDGKARVDAPRDVPSRAGVGGQFYDDGEGRRPA